MPDVGMSICVYPDAIVGYPTIITDTPVKSASTVSLKTF